MIGRQIGVAITSLTSPAQTSALAAIRMRGLWSEASTLVAEINSLKAEIARLTKLEP